MAVIIKSIYLIEDIVYPSIDDNWRATYHHGFCFRKNQPANYFSDYQQRYENITWEGVIPMPKVKCKEKKWRQFIGRTCQDCLQRVSGDFREHTCTRLERFPDMTNRI